MSTESKAITATSTQHGLTVLTKFLPATGSRGPRVKASLVDVDFPTKTVGWDYELGLDTYAKVARDYAAAWAATVQTKASIRLVGGYVGNGLYAWHVVFEGELS